MPSSSYRHDEDSSRIQGPLSRGQLAPGDGQASIDPRLFNDAIQFRPDHNGYSRDVEPQHGDERAADGPVRNRVVTDVDHTQSGREGADRGGHSKSFVLQLIIASQ